MAFLSVGDVADDVVGAVELPLGAEPRTIGVGAEHEELTLLAIGGEGGSVTAGAGEGGGGVVVYVVHLSSYVEALAFVGIALPNKGKAWSRWLPPYHSFFSNCHMFSLSIAGFFAYEENKISDVATPSSAPIP
jgi:hypothetical protein